MIRILLTVTLAAWFDCTPTGPAEPETFDDKFYRALIFNAEERPDKLYTNRSRVLDDPGALNVYVETDRWPEYWPEGHPNPASRAERLAWMESQIPSMVLQLTGQEWTGRFEHGPLWHPDNLEELNGWTTVKVRDWPDESCHASGSVGQVRNYIWLDININPEEGEHHCLIRAFAHEFAHNLGLYHADGTINLKIDDDGTVTFSPKVVYHSRLAYLVGRGAAYPGPVD